MKDLVKSEANLIPFKASDVVEIEILNKTKNAILADVAGLTVGFIPEREWGEEGEELKPGDRTLAYVLLVEDERGQPILSLKRADQERLNLTLNEKYKNKETVLVKVKEANKGGLLCEIGSVRGFLPVSQLSSAHYPRVFGDKNKILTKLKELINQTLSVKIIGFDKKTNHPIFSEKAALGDLASSIKIGEILEGTVSGITDFGIFVNLGQIDGLVHISEASWNRIDDLSSLVKVGEKVKAKVIDKKNGRIFLSFKRLLPDPFLKAIEKYKEGDSVKGEVVKIVPFGAFVKLGEVEGLVHFSELSKKEISDPKKIIQEGKKYQFKIIKIDKENHRINLSLIAVNAKAQKKTAKTPKKTKKKVKS
jgi:ribosomal protein S1